jgi:predicted dehydrogenase
MKIRLGMVGGGTGAFIGEVHRIAARLDNRYELVAGAFSSDSERARQSAAALGIAPERAYDDFSEMAEKESAREDGIDVVAIVTPNHLHHAPAKCFLEAGIHVICDKPLSASLADALDLKRLVEETGLLFAVTYNYSGYPMVRQAREMIRNGDLGTLRVVQVEYPQEWLSTDLESTGQKQAAWRTDPARAGAGGSLGDIGTHAFHLTEFITGLEVNSLLADLSAFVPSRLLDDNAQIMLRFANGARGSLWASQVAVGMRMDCVSGFMAIRQALNGFRNNPTSSNFASSASPLSI